uniref:Tyr recombinase domain-containing protein n=1 Tax=Amphimedon queenslandica TaxID=400682 RepID=A0A1X7V1I2_AMPQE
MLESAGTITRYTNHSLLATFTTCLFESGVSQKIMQEKSGHCSLTALRQYERVTTKQQRCVTKILGSADLNVVKSDIKKDQEGEEEGKENEKPRNEGAVFSGQFSNCVNNFYAT